jgi:hypothetical protein
MVKYVFINSGTSFHERYNHEATTNLDASRRLPMIKIGMGADAKIATRPMIE